MTGTIFVTPRFRPVDLTGTPLPGCSLTFYEAGSNTTLAPVYTTAALAVEHPNPLYADEFGQFPPVYLDPDAGYDYRIVLQRADGSQEWAEDNYPAVGSGTGSGGSGGSGTPGEPGLSVSEINVYQRADSAPATPTGGSYSFATLTLTPPAGWTREVPTGSAPVWQSATVAAVDGATGTDSLLTWSTPVKVFADGQGTNVIFRRNAGQPATPAPSVSVPANWYDSVDNVPASSDTLWSSFGTRAYEGANWVWQLPTQVEGDQGPPGNDGADGILYYCKPVSGTAIKNGSGTLHIEAHKVQGGTDTKLTSGTIKLYVGSTLVSVANGYAAGSDGYDGYFDSTDISGSVVVTLKDGVAGDPLDTITLVDVIDGSIGGVGADAVWIYCEASNGLAFTRAADQTTWSPSTTNTRLDFTAVQGGVAVARVAWLCTVNTSTGVITGATTTHGAGDLNGSRMTITEINEGTAAFTVKCTYSYSGDISSTAETVITSMAGANGSTGGTGPTGPGALVLAVTKPVLPVMAYQNGTVVSLAAATGQATLYEGTTDRTAASTINAVVATGCTGRINTALNTPIAGQAKGYYQIDTLTADTATLVLSATYGGNTATHTVAINRVYVGYEIVTSLPATNLFTGRVVFLTADSKLYRYDGSSWTRSVDGADLVANSITTNAINAGAVTAAKISVTQLSALTANMGTLTAGTVRDASSGFTSDYNNARIVFDTAPGSAGVGFVRIMGYGFGPTNQFIDWYGPKPAGQSTHAGIIGALTETDALSYQKTDGTFVSVGRQRGEFEPKAWGTFDGKTGSTATIKDRFNVSTIVRNSTGDYTVTFAAPVANANYAVLSNADRDGDGANVQLSAASGKTTSGFNLNVRGTGGGLNDALVISFYVIGSNVVGGSNVSAPTGGFGGGTRGRGNVP